MKREICPVCCSPKKEIFYKRDFSCMGDIVPFSRYDVLQCKNCGLIYAGNIQEVMPLNDYYNELSKYETDAYALSELSHKECVGILNLFDRFVNRDCKILDVGCGNGNLLNMLKQNGYCKLLGIEPSEKNVNLIKKQYSIDAYAGSMGIDEFPIEKHSIDLIVMIGVLEHIMDIDAFLTACSEYLSDNGKFCVAVPDIMQFSDDIDLYQQFSVEHINFFNKSSLENIFKNYGFKNIVWDNSLRGEVVGIWNLEENNNVEYKNNSEGKDMIKKYINGCRELESRIKSKMERYLDRPLYIWGAGTHTATLSQEGILKYLKIVSIIDSNANYTDKLINGIAVRNPNSMVFEDHPILISSKWAQQSILEDIRGKYKLNNEVILLY